MQHRCRVKLCASREVEVVEERVKREGAGMVVRFFVVRPTACVPATTDFTHTLVSGNEKCDLLPGEHLRRVCVGLGREARE